MATKPYEGVLLKRFFPYEGVWVATQLLVPHCWVYPTLNEMLLKKQEAIIKKIKPKKDLDDLYDHEGNQQLGLLP